MVKMLKNLWLYSLRFYLRLGLFFYFRTFKVVGKENIPADKSLLVLGNHQSALIDPLLLAVVFPQFAYYLTRAAVFKKNIVRMLLNSVNMLPVFRIRDGWSNLTNNNPVFEKCRELLHEKRTIVIFPEGSHNLRRTVRPLSKGFTRIVLDTLEAYPDTDMYLLPVGFNYENAVNFPDSASVYFGKPIRTANLLMGNIHENVITLKNTVHYELTKLTTHIPAENYDEQLSKLKSLNADFLNPVEVNACLQNENDCFKREVSKNRLELLKPLVYLNLLFPVAIWRLFVKPKIKEAEFVATFRFAIAVVLIPLWLLVITCVLLAYFGSLVAGIYLLVSILLMLLYVKA